MGLDDPAAQRQAEHATEQARRANREKELMLREDAKRNSFQYKKLADGSQQEIEMLRKTRDELQREMQKLEQQIRQLERSNRERERKQVDERKDADEPSGDNQPLQKK